MGGSAGVDGISKVVLVIRSEVLVLRLSWLGLRFIADILGRMKDGDVGSDISEDVEVVIGRG